MQLLLFEFLIVMIGIYKIRNILNNKIYVGKSTNIKSRFEQHKARLRGGVHNNIHLQRSWLKYTELNFEFSIIEICEETELAEREFFWVEFFKCNKYELGYNKAIIEKDGSFRHSEETKLKFSLRMMGNKLFEEHKEAVLNARKNKIVSKETKKKMSETHKKIWDDRKKAKNL